MSTSNTHIIKYNHPNWEEFLVDLEKQMLTLPPQDLIVDLSAYSQISKKDLNHLKPFAKNQRKLKQAFVVVTPVLSYDQIPEVISSAPTLTEAFDLVEMEQIERDLGF